MNAQRGNIAYSQIRGSNRFGNGTAIQMAGLRRLWAIAASTMHPATLWIAAFHRVAAVASQLASTACLSTT